MSKFLEPLRQLCSVGRAAAILVLLHLTAVGAAAQDPVADGGSESGNGPAQTVAVDGIAEDDVIRARLMKIYDAAGKAGWLTEADVEVASGIVTLRGAADTDEHRQWAENIARNT